MMSLIGNVVKVLLFMANLWGERNATRARQKAEVLKEVVDAFQETDRKTQASLLNHCVSRINDRM